MCRPTLNPINPKPIEYMELLTFLYRQQHPDQTQQTQDETQTQDGAQPTENDTAQQQRQRRSLRFSFVVETAAGPGPLDNEEVKELWYNKKEIATFKIQARRLIQSCCVRNKTRQLNRDEIDSLRGLESCAMERQMYRRRSIQCTLTAMERGMSAEEVSQIYQACLSWNTELAKIQAHFDFCTVYEPARIHLVRRMSNIPPKFSFPLKRVSTTTTNRSECNSDEEQSLQFERRVRRRVEA